MTLEFIINNPGMLVLLIPTTIVGVVLWAVFGEILARKARRSLGPKGEDDWYDVGHFKVLIGRGGISGVVGSLLAPTEVPYPRTAIRDTFGGASREQWFHLGHYPRDTAYGRKGCSTDEDAAEMDEATRANRGNWQRFDFGIPVLDQFFTVRRAQPVFIPILQQVWGEVAANNPELERTLRPGGRRTGIHCGSSKVGFLDSNENGFSRQVRPLIEAWEPIYKALAQSYEKLPDSQKKNVFSVN